MKAAMTLQRWLILAAGLLLSGCSTLSEYTTEYFSGQDNTDPPAELVSFTPTLYVDKVWTADIGSGSRKLYLKLTPIIAYGKVYAANAKGKIVAYDAASGSQLWNKDTGVQITGGPGSGEGMVFVGTSDAEILALDAENGNLRWRTRVSSEVLSAPRAEDGVVVVRTVDDKLVGLNAGDGKKIWVYDSSVPVLTLRGTSLPVLFRGAVITGLANGKLVALTLRDGKTIWETRISVPSGRSDLERMVDIDAEPLVGNGVIHVVTYQGKIATLDLRSGDQLWQRDMSSHAGIGMDTSYLYVSDDRSHIWALDRKNGSSLWKQARLQARAVTAPVVQGDFVVVGDMDGFLHWMSAYDGGFTARVRVDDSPIVAPPFVVDDLLYVITQQGTLSVYRIRS